MTIGVIGVVALPIVVAALAFSGFCFKERRFLSDEEKILIAVKHALRHYPPSLRHVFEVEGSPMIVNTARPKHPIPYEGIDEFFKLNPTCCRVITKIVDENGETKIDLWHKLSGRMSCFVELKYLVRYVDDFGDRRAVQVKSHSALSSCGYLGGI